MNLNLTKMLVNPVWVTAMDIELKALESNKTWELVPLPTGKIAYWK